MTRTVRTLAVTVLLLTGLAGASDAQSERISDGSCNRLFLHSARSVELTANTLTMQGASPTVLYFCDRPVRSAGQMSIQDFVASVSAGKDSFVEKPPNAAISMVDGAQMSNVVVTLNRLPRVDGDQLVYENVTILQGQLPGLNGPGTLFIDSIGRVPPVPIAGCSTDVRGGPYATRPQ